MKDADLPTIKRQLIVLGGFLCVALIVFVGLIVRELRTIENLHKLTSLTHQMQAQVMMLRHTDSVFSIARDKKRIDLLHQNWQSFLDSANNSALGTDDRTKIVEELTAYRGVFLLLADSGTKQTATLHGESVDAVDRINTLLLRMRTDIDAAVSREVGHTILAASLLSVLIAVAIIVVVALFVERLWVNNKRLKHAKKLLKKNYRYQQQILNNIIEVVVTMDESRKIIDATKSSERVFGHPAKDVRGRNFNELLSGDNPVQFNDYLTTAEGSDRHKPLSCREVMARHKNGDLFPMRLSVSEMPGDKYIRKYYVACCYDISEIRTQEEQLRRAQKMDALGKLTSGVAHDYNNTLGVILGYADLLARKLRDDPKMSKYATEVVSAAERGKKLTQKLLAFSRNKRVEIEACNINLLLLDKEHMLSKILTPRIELRLMLADNLWKVEIEKGDLEDAVVNICINAMHAMPDGGTMTLGTSNEYLSDSDANKLGVRPGEYVRLALSDTGVGMDDQTLGRVFDPFFSTKGEKGTGLGLSQVYGSIKRAEGAVQVESELGEGSCFSMYYPRYQCGEVVTEKPSMRDRRDLYGRETILVVDDEPPLRNLIEEVLTSHGYRVLLANSGESALAILERDPVDLLLSDVIMPGMDGFELARKVQEKFPKVKIQLLSGFNDNRLDSVDDFLLQNILKKPFHTVELLQSVRHSFSRDSMLAD